MGVAGGVGEERGGEQGERGERRRRQRGLEEEEGHSSCWEKVKGLHNTGLKIREVSKGSSRKKLKIKIRPKQIEQESKEIEQAQVCKAEK